DVNSFNIHKSSLPAFEASASFDEAVNQMLKTSPKMVLAHIRLAAPQCKEVVTVNNHPFQYEKWNFMHNGIVTGAFQPTIQNALQEMYPAEKSQSNGNTKTLPIKGPKGTTDSEASLYYWMGLMQKKYGSVDSQVVGKAQVRQSFADAIHDLIQASPPIYSDLKGSVLNIQGKIQVAPSMNFVASDGNLLLAFRKGAKLYLGMRRVPGQPAKSLSSQEYILSSEPIQPGKGFARIQWLDIPEEMILTLSRGASGAIEPELYPLSFFKRSQD
ncbi:MAG: class II glutamine amidotransferase, partial [Cyanobacteria bacterium]|nr:class II glutamine amidotransferase [Cyanobacteriota bacterium]